MRILYGFSNCTDGTYNRIVREHNVSTMVPDQKYHGLLIKGLAQNGAEVRCFSGLPVNRAVTSRLIVREKDEREGNAYYHYITTINLPILRHLMIFFGTFFSVLRAKKDKDTYALCDGLNFANTLGMLFATKARKIKIVLIMTDLPNVQTTSAIRPWLNGKILNLADGFVFLTEYMSQRLNKKNMPYIVLEGHVDSEIDISNVPERTERINGKRIVMYAGSLHRIYGIENLIGGFLKADIPDSELHIYGDGDYREEIVYIASIYPNIKFYGVKPNEEIVKREQEASILVNPRPVIQEFTPYSFPSKNLEYMLSGTPTLTTRLPGIPEEYLSYIYLFENDTIEGIAMSLKDVLQKSLSEREEKARDARAFVMNYKSNMIQSKKIIEFLQKC